MESRYSTYMVRKEFPDLNWLKATIRQRQTASLGWPATCILNVRTENHRREDVLGPLSIFSNRSGVSYIWVDGHRVRLEPGQYFLTNSGQSYSLEYEAGHPTETLNVHLEEHLAERMLSSLVQPKEKLLDQPDQDRQAPVHFFPHLHQQNQAMQQLLGALVATKGAAAPEGLAEEEKLFALVTHLMQEHRNILKDVARLPARKASTREELYHRLAIARDYIHSHYTDELNLEELATQACMSRYHFLRLFKQAYRQSPYQYVKSLRLEKAREWLCNSREPVGEIAYRLGYQNISSFSRVFQQAVGSSPKAYRLERAPKKFATLVK